MAINRYWAVVILRIYSPFGQNRYEEIYCMQTVERRNFLPHGDNFTICPYLSGQNSFLVILTINVF